MQKSLSKEPIYLTMLKRKSKINEETTYKNDFKETLKYDLERSQQWLHPQKVRQTYKVQENLLDHLNTSKKKLRVPSASLNALNPKEEKNVFERLFDGPQSIYSKQIPSQLLYSKASQTNYAKEKPIFNKQNTILDQPQLLNLKARAISTINSCKADIIKEVKLFQSYHSEKVHPNIQEKVKKIIDSVESNQKESIISQYEQRILKLQENNRDYLIKISELELKLFQKQAVANRVAKIQRDLCELIEQNQQLHKLNQSLSRSRFKDVMVESYVQTESFPKFVRDSYCQTQIPQLQFHNFGYQIKKTPHSYEKQTGLYGVQHQKNDTSLNDRQLEYKSIIENDLSQSRHKIDMMQQQLQAATTKFQSKCQELSQKQAIFHKYLLERP